MRGPWLKRYGYHLSINNNRQNGNWSLNNFNRCSSHKVRIMSRIAGNFRGGANFREKLSRVFKINFCGFKIS